MSLLSKSPNRPSTHPDGDLNRLMKLGCTIEAEADNETIDHALLDDMAADSGVGVEDLYAAAALTTDLKVKREHDVSFTVCAGKCQRWGAMSVLEHLAQTKNDREDEGQSSFDICVKSCLDQCHRAAVVVVTSPNGTAILDEAKPSDMDEAIAELCN